MLKNKNQNYGGIIMKKLIAIMLCSVMTASLVGCSDLFETFTDSVSEEDVRGEQITNKESVEEDSEEKDATEESETEETETENNEKEFSMGKTDGLVYENEFIGIGCALDSNWRFYSDEEIMELNNFATDAAGEEFEKLLQEANIIYDMYATSDNELDNINVNLEKMSKLQLNKLVIKDTLEQTIPMLRDAYSNMGYTDFQAELDTVNIEGEEIDCLSMSAQIDGLNVYQKTFGIKCNGYLASITVTAYKENTVDSIVEKFYFVE